MQLCIRLQESVRRIDQGRFFRAWDLVTGPESNWGARWWEPHVWRKEGDVCQRVTAKLRGWSSYFSLGACGGVLGTGWARVDRETEDGGTDRFWTWGPNNRSIKPMMKWEKYLVICSLWLQCVFCKRLCVNPLPWHCLVLSPSSVCWVAGSPLHSDTKVECVTQCRFFQRCLGTWQHELWTASRASWWLRLLTPHILQQLLARHMVLCRKLCSQRPHHRACPATYMQFSYKHVTSRWVTVLHTAHICSYCDQMPVKWMPLFKINLHVFQQFLLHWSRC